MEGGKKEEKAGKTFLWNKQWDT